MGDKKQVGSPIMPPLQREWKDTGRAWSKMERSGGVKIKSGKYVKVRLWLPSTVNRLSRLEKKIEV